MSILRKKAGKGLAAFALAAGLGGGAAAQNFDHEAYLNQLWDAAKAKGQTEVAMYSNNSLQFKELFATFEDKYGIDIKVTDMFGPPLVARLEADYATGNVQADILMSGPSDLIVFKQHGWLESWVPENAKGVMDPNLYGPDDAWVSFAALPLGTMVNTTLVEEKDYPKTNADMVTERWRGKIAMNKPHASSGLSQGVGVLLENGVIDFAYLEKLAALDPLIAASARASMDLVITGQRELTPYISLNSFLTAKEKGAPVALIFPSDGYSAIAAPNGLAKNAPHPEAGKLLLAWFQSPEAQALFTKSGQPGVMPGAPAPEGYPELSTLPRKTMSADWLQNEYPKMLERNTKIFSQ
jgi:iron(III) transport system substrate-binding protein